MALTFSKTITVFGDQRVSYGTATMDGVTSGAFDTGLDVVNGLSITPASTTTTTYAYQVAKNAASGGTATNGYVQITTATAGDTFHVVAFGK